MRAFKMSWPLLLAAMLLSALAAELSAQEERGKRERAARDAEGQGWLGIMFDVDESAPRSVVIREVFPRSPADRAGLEPGDVLLRWNGRRAAGDFLREQRLAPGETVRLRIERDGREREVEVVAERRNGRVAGPRVQVLRPSEEDEDRLIIIDGDTTRLELGRMRAEIERAQRELRAFLADSLRLRSELGEMQRELQRSLPEIRIETERMREDSLHFDDEDAIVLRGEPARVFTFTPGAGRSSVAGAEFTPLNPELAEYFRGVRDGLLVLRVASRTPADRAGLEPGDVITRVDGERVDDVGELRRAVARAGRRGEVRLDVVRKGEERTVRLRWE